MKKQTTAAFLMVVLGLFHPRLTDLRAQGPQEGIKVHGHWTIDVRQPDGTLVTHREFDNSLELSGGLALSSVLARQKTIGKWSVYLGAHQVTQQPCLAPAVGPLGCNLTEVGGVNGETYFATLTVSAPHGSVNGQPVPNKDSLVLSGTATAQRVGLIGVVGTSLGACPASVLPGDCSSYSNDVIWQFSSAHLAVLVNGSCSGTACEAPVQPGQIIQVTVVISFS